MQICTNEWINVFVKSVIFNCAIFVPFVLYYIYLCILRLFIFTFLHLFISVFLSPYVNKVGDPNLSQCRID